MRQPKTPFGKKDSAGEQALYMAMELSNRQWKLGFTDRRRKIRRVTIEARNLVALQEQIGQAKSRFGLPEDAPVFSCYEAGRDGFWLHHYLVSRGIDNQVLEPSSIKVDRRRRRAKTDRLDVERMLMQLLRYLDGDTEELHVVRVPTQEQEDGRRLHREQLRLKDERKVHRTRINALLVTQGIELKVRSDFRKRLEQLTGWDGSALGADLRAELEREYVRLELVESQLRTLEAEQQRRLEQRQVPQMQAIVHLMGLRGVGRTGAWILVMEFFGWRDFHNRREVASAAGLTGTPYDSGDSEHEQGISKAGNVRIRWLIVQLAWDWLRYQPESQLSLWFRERFGEGKRLRRIGIVALARRLLIALWRYVEHGVVPEGAQLKAS
jgi:transposase